MLYLMDCMAMLYTISKKQLSKQNQQTMLVTVDFEKDGVEYRIERGRKPNVFKFLVGGMDSNDM